MKRHCFPKLPLVAFATFLIFASLATAEEPKSDYFEVDGVKIHYITAGKGEPVVLIHGLYSSSATNWRLPGTFGALAKNYEVVAVDLPGHGLSDKPDAADAYGEQLVEVVVALMDHLKFEKAHVVGYSMGGMVSMKLLTKHPDRLLSVALCGMGWLRDGSPQQRLWARMPGGTISKTPISFVHAMADLAITEDELKAIQIPVEVIVGDNDPIRKNYVEPLKEARNDWNVVLIADAEHLICVFKPEFKEAIVNWIKTNSK